MLELNALVAQPPPLRQDEAGGIRVGSTRVSLDSVIYDFKNGIGAEEIVMRYPSLKLEDVYAVIAYYLWYRQEIEAYLLERQRQAEERIQEIRSASPWKELWERLPGN
jgi:uncharacterized protein (DUF433 family)